MSKQASAGPGRVQRNLVAIFQAKPGHWFTVGELVALAFPVGPWGHSEEVSIRRALKTLPLALSRERVGAFGATGSSLRLKFTG